MSLEAILNEIRAAGKAQVQEIEEDARKQAATILAEAQLEFHRIEGEACAAASAPAAAERARLLHAAHLEALQIVGQVRETLVDAALAQAREDLASFHTDACYPQVLRALTEEALAGLAQAGKVQISANLRDKMLLENILGELKQDLPITYDLDGWGGLIVSSEDGQVVAINTLEARLERAMPFLRNHLAAWFEQDHG